MIYAFIVAALSIIGALVPLRYRPGHKQLQVYISLAAGALLGAALFHMLPHSTEHIGESFGMPLALGVITVFLMQRYLAPHSHELSAEESHKLDAAQGSAAQHAHHHCAEHEHFHSAGPFLSGVVAILALAVHSFFDGVAIGAAIASPKNGDGSLTLSVFLSVLIHKPMDGLSVAVLLLNAGVSRKTFWLVQAGYAALVPVGALIFGWSQGAVAEPAALVGYTMAFSAGTFLAVALADLLPELQFHRHDRNILSGALLLGMAVMWVTSLIGHGSHGHDHGSHGHSHAPAKTDTPVAPDEPHDHDHPDDHDHEGHDHHDH